MIHDVINWPFRINSKKKGLKARSHKACFEDPSCSLVNYEILEVTKGCLRYYECQHGSSRNHDQHRLHVATSVLT